VSDSVKDTGTVQNFPIFSDEQTVKTTPFGRNIAGENAYRRAERIVAALFLVTGHVDANEPLRIALRRMAPQLLHVLLDLRRSFRASGSETHNEAQALIRELISLTRLSTVGGFVSVANAETVVAALDELGVYLTSAQRSVFADDLSLSRDTLNPRPVPPPRAIRSSPQRPIERPISVKDGEVQTDKQVSVTISDSAKGQSDRATRILDILASGNALGIREISLNLPEYSEKMIQRELATLVQSGLVRKSGAKRWSQYSLAKAT